MSRDYIVPDLLAPNLRLLFCGTAPSRESAKQQAYYAHPGNQFWKVLHRVGITPGQFTPQEFAHLMPLSIGLTDVCKTASGNDDELPDSAIDTQAVVQKIRRYKPKLVAFTSKHTAQLYYGHKVEFGLQKELVGNTQFFVLCSTSGRARRFWREELWLDLAALYKAGGTSR